MRWDCIPTALLKPGWAALLSHLRTPAAWSAPRWDFARVTIVQRSGGRSLRGRMNWLDLLIVGILAWTTFRAFTNGLIREVVSLLGLVAGVALSGAFYDDLSSNLEFVIADPTSRSLVAFAAIFIGTTVAGAVIGSVLHTAAALLFLGPLDKLGGAAFGLLKGLLLVQILLAVAK